MRRGLALLGLITSVAGRGIGAQAVNADKGVQVVRNASKAYQALSSFQAQFQQHFEDRSVDQPDSRGTLYQEGKTKFAMRWSDPPKDAVIADGTWLWMYLPSTSPGKVLRYQQQASPTYGSNLLGTFLDNAVERYRITYVKFEVIDGHVVDAVLMEPARPGEMPFVRATVWFDRELGMPRKFDIEELRDRHRIVSLSGLQQNRTIASDVFKCEKFPSGTRIVNQ